MSPENNHSTAVPVAIRRGDGTLDLVWDEAGHVGRYPMRDLRLACPCAACVDEMTNRPLLDPATVPPDVTAAGVELVGAYGIRVRWSDGHATGIYTFGVLRARCPCAECAAARG